MMATINTATATAKNSIPIAPRLVRLLSSLSNKRISSLVMHEQYGALSA